jgi:hypothetical protein
LLLVATGCYVQQGFVVFAVRVATLHSFPSQHLLRTDGIIAAVAALLSRLFYAGFAVIAFLASTADFAVRPFLALAAMLFGVGAGFFVLPCVLAGNAFDLIGHNDTSDKFWVSLGLARFDSVGWLLRFSQNGFDGFD